MHLFRLSWVFLLHRLFSSCGEQALLLLQCGDLSSCRAGALGLGGVGSCSSWAPQGLGGIGSCGSWALEHRLNNCGAWSLVASRHVDPPGSGIK